VRVDRFDYELPRDLIASEPVTPRDSSRLLVLDRSSARLTHSRFYDLPEFVRPGDCLVLNDTKVVAARLIGRRRLTGGKWQGLFLGERDGCWELLAQTRGAPRPIERIVIEPGGWELQLVTKTDEGTWLARPSSDQPTMTLLESSGQAPLPPYISRRRPRVRDRDDYQTVFARQPGAVAAPTAGLHFTHGLLNRLAALGIETAFVTLHVGLGTFQPVKVADTADHQMRAEWFCLTAQAADRINRVRAGGGRIVAVGTTTARVLESVVADTGKTAPRSGWTRLFITPPYTFRAIDALITNFHLPKSTLLMLVCAFAGMELIRAAYRAAIAERYRFYSFGDAMLIV
jgi:S-adenosylmethionine:tRNA ribosyltransferase-isomerase